MNEFTHSDYIRQLHFDLKALSGDESTARRVLKLREEVLALSMLDFSPAAATLREGYSPAAGGRPPRNPINMLRSIALMALKGQNSFNKWVEELRDHPELHALSGFDREKRSPGVGTFYDFCDRLLDGPFQKKCPHTPAKRSSAFKGSRGAFRRNLKGEKEAAKKLASQGPQGDETPVLKAVSNAMEQLGSALPRDLETRLNEILMKCAVVPSAQKGLLGPLKKLETAADGTLIESQALGRGKPLCSCEKEGLGKCSCDRSYSDPQATWGYSSHKEHYIFGHRLHAIVVPTMGVDLPIYLSRNHAKVVDSVMVPDALSRMTRMLQTHLPEAHLHNFIADAGYDARPLYEMLLHLGARPFIPLHPRTKPLTSFKEIPLNEQGVPLCPGGLPMKYHGFNGRRQKLVYHCPIKRLVKRSGKPVFIPYLEECPRGALCEVLSKMGPLIALPVDEDPRLFVPVARGSKKYVAAMKRRTSSERFFSQYKGYGQMGRRPYRRGHLYEIMGMAHGLRAHGLAWVRKRYKKEMPTDMKSLLDTLVELRKEHEGVQRE